MWKKLVSVFLCLVLCFSNIMGVNASPLEKKYTSQKDISKVEVSKEIKDKVTDESDKNNIKPNLYYSSTSDYPLKSTGENDGYVVVSNESVDYTSSQYTGKFSIDNSKYSLNKNLQLHDYKLDVNLPFDTDKNKDKLLLNKNGYGKSITPSYQVGDNKNFYVVNFINNNDESLNATLYYSGTKANVWVNNNEISKSDAAKLGAEFENNIHSKVTKYFGSESDVDNDGKINILCYDIKDGFSGSGGYIGGYFYARDLYNVAYSNKSEIFYIDTYPALSTSSGYKDVTNCYETLAHEFQHMTNFNQSVFKEGSSSSMDTWLDEGMSMAAEQVYTGKPLNSRIDYYNSSRSISNGHSLLYWDNDGDVLSNYSLSYLFLQYFKLQTGQGNAIFKELQELGNNNYEDIEILIKKYIDPNLTFGQFLTEFRAALLLKESTGLRGFKGDSNFDGIETPLYSGSGTYLRGGGAVVKEADTSNFEIPSYKGENVTFTLIKTGEQSNEKPVISGANDKTIKVGESFNPREGVSASDKEDGDLTSKIQISGSVDTTKSGKYNITYKVVDSDNNQASKSIVITVNAPPVIKATNKKIKVGDSFNAIQGISASDEEDGDLTDKIQITSNTVNKNKAGKYKVTYKVLDSQGASYTKTITVSVYPKKAQNVKATSKSYNSIMITWDKLEGVDGYEVYRATSYSGTYSLKGTISSASTLSYTNKSLTTGKNYYYKVRGYGIVNGEKIYGEFSSVSSTKPKLSTTSGKATSKSYNSILVSWSKVSGADGYNIYRSTSKNGTYSLVKTVTSGSTLSYTNTSLTTGKTYYYKIKSYRNVNGSKVYSNYSSSFSAKPLLSKPSVTLSSGTKKVYVKWGRVSGSSGYEIYRSTRSGGTYSKVKTITSGKTTSYTNSGLTSKKTYYYKVRAYKTVNGKKVYSSYSTIKSIKVK